jgi:hypothetical protein
MGASAVRAGTQPKGQRPWLQMLALSKWANANENVHIDVHSLIST